MLAMPVAPSILGIIIVMAVTLICITLIPMAKPVMPVNYGIMTPVVMIVLIAAVVVEPIQRFVAVVPATMTVLAATLMMPIAALVRLAPEWGITVIPLPMKDWVAVLG